MNKNSILRKLIAVILAIGCLLSFASCKVTVTPSVTFAFKNVDSAADYNESLTSFEVGKRFYTCIAINLVTDKKKPIDYQVVITVPKTNEVEVKGMGGLEPDSIEWDEEKEETVLTFTVQGYKEATPEKILFYGTPTGEGEAKMTVKIYDDKGEKINKGYTRTIFFVYELQE